MSLQVWLPLNGDLHNQGLSDITVTNNGATTNNSGKIGKCYSFNGTSNYLKLDPIFSNGNQILSFSCWIKIDALPSSYYCLLSSRTNTNNTGVNIYLKSDKTFYIDIGSRWITSVQNIEVNTWYHITVVSSDENRILYINGVQKDISTTIHTAPTTVNTNFVLIGAQQTSAAGTADGTYFKGYMNDVRIYDHALSPKEIEEISKGLVLHYKLDNNGMGNPNLISNSIYNVDPWLSTVKAIEMYHGKYAYRVSNNTLYTKTGSGANDLFNNTIIYKDNTQYTLSVDWRDDYRTDNKNSSLYFRFNYTDGSTTTQIISPSYTIHEWVHSKMTSTSGKTISKISTTYGNGGQLYIANLKLEEGTQDTGWALPADEWPTVAYDASGYGNNGNIVGNLTRTVDTPRYECSTHSIKGSYIRVLNRPAACMPKDAITVNLWVKFSTWGNPISCTESGGWNFEEANGGIRFITYIASVGYKHAQSTITSASIKNNWHMFTGTMNKDYVKFYIDGVEQGSIENGSTNGISYYNNYVFVAAEASSNNTSPANSNYVGDISDVRIYATALTPTQIKELYDTSASIDAFGNAYAREVIE